MNISCTSNDVAKLAGVSQPTVSRVINNHPGISPSTALKVREAAKKIGYEPGRASIRKGHRPKIRRTSYRKMQVALISQVSLKQLQTPIYSKLMHGIEDELGKLNYSLIIRNLPIEQPEDSIPRKIDGAILFHVMSIQTSPRLLRKLRMIPCVSVMGEAEDNEFFDHVTYDNRKIGKVAAEYLLSKGHKDLLYLSKKVDTKYYKWFNRRGEDFIATVRKSGAKAFEILTEDLIDESGSVQLPNIKNLGRAIEEIKKLPQIPTAIFVPADIFTAGLYHTLRHYDIIPGKDIEIVGVNNDSLTLNHFSPRPASVDIHPEAIGRKAVERLLRRMDNPKEPLEKILLEPEMAFT